VPVIPPVNRPVAHLVGIDLVRGAAALAVCCWHLTTVAQGNSWFHVISSYGYLGVQAFFVVSGFVIPYSLDGHAYQLRSYGRFLLKRFVRLEPPYLASMLFVVGLMWIVPQIPGVGGKPVIVEPGRMLSHVAYLWTVFGYEALNPVYWTLAIEVQFYVMAGLLFPLWASGRLAVRTAAVVGLSALALGVPEAKLVIHWLPLFALGVCGFLYHVGVSTRNEAVVHLAIISSVAVATHGLSATVVGLVTLGVILFCPAPLPPLLVGLGAMSYSLYLVHVPIGSRIASFGNRFGPDLQGWFIFAGLTGSLAGAWLFWLAIERRAHQWSRTIRYDRRLSPSASPFVQ
jgi:peptidoglycan/LPS O-acetylase OafA/YrhL